MSEQAAEWAVRLRLAFQQAITPDDMREIAQHVVKDAKRGDPQAIKLLMQLLTPPQPQVGRVGPINVTSGGGNGRRPKVVPQIPNGEGE